ncbi:hypothetical protein K0M31_018508 [Melipona bicolor]|uniref:Uncharacterized protein n=1 Tax=Melipona bicolor TaxID=60889 RepID=A0AA40KRQ6_9HYME|nr:hypothetical protein K0M31_018508 [Melipona bicolor]
MVTICIIFSIFYKYVLLNNIRRSKHVSERKKKGTDFKKVGAGTTGQFLKSPQCPSLNLDFRRFRGPAVIFSSLQLRSGYSTDKFRFRQLIVANGTCWNSFNSIDILSPTCLK